VLTVVIVGEEHVLYLDGEEVRRYKPQPARLGWLYLWANEGTVLFDRILLRKRE